MVLHSATSAQHRAKTRHRASVLGVLGEILITISVVILLYIVWQTWINNVIVSNAQRDEAIQISQEWNKDQPVKTAPVERPDPGEPVVAVAPGAAQVIGNLIVPRFGADYTRTIYETVDLETVLNRRGVGHYKVSQMPGEIGNFALAAHRTGWGDPFIDINKLQLNDSIYVETEAGWYRYVFRSLEYVTPQGIGVLDPVPQQSGMPATERILTLTSCNPKFDIAERLIAYSVYDTWYPRSEGAPPEIAALFQ